MPFSIAHEQGRQILKLAGSITIRNVQEFAARLGEDLEDGTSVGVDAAGLEDIDTCSLQLLCSLRKTVPALSFVDPSEAFVAAVERTGLRRELLGSGDES